MFSNTQQKRSRAYRINLSVPGRWTLTLKVDLKDWLLGSLVIILQTIFFLLFSLFLNFFLLIFYTYSCMSGMLSVNLSSITVRNSFIIVVLNLFPQSPFTSLHTLHPLAGHAYCFLINEIKHLSDSYSFQEVYPFPMKDIQMLAFNKSTGTPS